MQSLNQGTGSPGFPTWMGMDNAYARYKNPVSIRHFKQSPLRPKNVVDLDTEYKRTFKESPKSIVNKSLDYSSSSLITPAYSKSIFGRGRGIQNIHFGKAVVDGEGNVPRDWKQGSLMRTSSEHKVNYLDDRSTLFPEIKKNRDRNLSNDNSYNYRSKNNTQNYLRFKRSIPVSPQGSHSNLKVSANTSQREIPSSGSISTMDSPMKVSYSS